MVFSLPASTASCERTFSSMNFIHNNLRNRIGDAKVLKLLFVYLNIQQLEKKRKREPETLEELDEVDFLDEIY